MIETSSVMRKMQGQTLIGDDLGEPKLHERYKSKHSSSIFVTWLSDINELPNDDSVHFFLANEFFDALPIHKFQVPFRARFAELTRKN